MKTFKDFQNYSIRLTDERLKHIAEHPEMKGMLYAIGETILSPEVVVSSVVDARANLYYRFYKDTKVGAKYLCVIVKKGNDPFVITAYLTDSIKKGDIQWRRKL